MPDYGWYRELGSFALDWSHQGDEWIHRLSEALGETSSVRVSGHRFDATTEPFIQVNLTLSGSAIDTRMLVAAVRDAIIVLAAGGQAPDEEVLSTLARAAILAGERLGDVGTDHAWTAVIGSPADGGIAGIQKRLGEPATVGNLDLESTGVALVEPDISQQTSISSWSIRQSVPILVKGTARGYSWRVAGARAARDLRTLCGLLSIAWDSELAIREAAAPLEWGPRQVPARPPWYAVEPATVLGALPDEANVPEWMDEAWTRVGENRQFLAAMDAFLEGIYASGRHPSLAAVAFTACVETLGGQLFEQQRCGTCHSLMGITRTFKATLRVVLPEDEAGQLDAVYPQRSGTVHRGQFHGGETTPGVQFMGIWSSDPARDFRWRALFSLRRACRLLLKRALVEGLPARQKLPER